MLHDRELARDIVHDVFVNLLENKPGIPVTESYLYIAVRNRVLNFIRDCDIHHKMSEGYFLENEEYEKEEWPDEETLEQIDHLVATVVSPQARIIIELRFKEGIMFSKIATRLGISENAVYRHLRHALVMIRKNLKNNE